MRFLEVCHSVVLYFAALLSPSPSLETYESQHPLEFAAPELTTLPGHGYPPKFPAPSGPDSAGPFVCKYPVLGQDWTDCSTPDNRGCWLRKKDGTEFNISTDYEQYYPQGVLREYWLEVTNKSLNLDGIANPDGKVFNNSYPGPWIQACWGDTIRIHVRNKLSCNGTSIHWHGVRQLHTTEMDGVNGVTQCPIAPGDTYTYEFVAMQYGTTWYHSHYSLQYADGLLGPLTIYGPSSANYDEARDPLLFTDWSHRSAFKDYDKELTGKPERPFMNSVLFNGTGNFAGAFPIQKFSMSVEKGKKYLLRIINTSVDTIYKFTIDNHQMTVISSDFVPIKPYNATSITVAIGQRYHVILDANPIPNNGWLSDSGDYWMRAIPADGCAAFEPGNNPDERQGILRYNASSTDPPTSWRPQISTACVDELYDDLIPIVPWTVDTVPLPPTDQWFDVGLQSVPGRPNKADKFTFWSIGDQPLWLNFSDPTLFDLNDREPDRVIISEDVTPESWIYLVIGIAPQSALGKNVKKTFVPAAHPIHLHGHDFAILAQGTNYSALLNNNITLRFTNPPRRDVALLPAGPLGGYLVIAFKADNPGIWLLHCHIAWHASSGLAMQILERQRDLEKMLTPERLKEPRRLCNAWDDWFAANSSACLIPPDAPFQDDSGI